MAATNHHRSDNRRLPQRLRQFFWDVPFDRLRWKTDRHLIISRILASGDWTAVRWLRSRVKDNALRSWLHQRQGAGLSPRQLRYWQLVLDLPSQDVDIWLALPGRQIWDRRRNP